MRHYLRRWSDGFGIAQGRPPSVSAVRVRDRVKVFEEFMATMSRKFQSTTSTQAQQLAKEGSSMVTVLTEDPEVKSPCSTSTSYSGGVLQFHMDVKFANRKLRHRPFCLLRFSRNALTMKRTSTCPGPQLPSCSSEVLSRTERHPQKRGRSAEGEEEDQQGKTAGPEEQRDQGK
jgi:hypothetical protein